MEQKRYYKADLLLLLGVIGSISILFIIEFNPDALDNYALGFTSFIAIVSAFFAILGLIGIGYDFPASFKSIKTNILRLLYFILFMYIASYYNTHV